MFGILEYPANCEAGGGAPTGDYGVRDHQFNIHFIAAAGGAPATVRTVRPARRRLVLPFPLGGSSRCHVMAKRVLFGDFSIQFLIKDSD